MAHNLTLAPGREVRPGMTGLRAFNLTDRRTFPEKPRQPIWKEIANVARIAGVNIPTNKRVEIALTYIHGIGRTKGERDLRARSRSRSGG